MHSWGGAAEKTGWMVLCPRRRVPVRGGSRPFPPPAGWFTAGAHQIPHVWAFVGEARGRILVAFFPAGNVVLLLFYSLGLGVPFLLLGLGVNQLSRVLKELKPHVGKIEVGTGVVMIAVGLVIFFNLLPYFNQFFNLGGTEVRHNVDRQVTELRESNPRHYIALLASGMEDIPFM